jgi:hypothetical protein
MPSHIASVRSALLLVVCRLRFLLRRENCAARATHNYVPAAESLLRGVVAAVPCYGVLLPDVHYLALPIALARPCITTGHRNPSAAPHGPDRPERGGADGTLAVVAVTFAVALTEQVTWAARAGVASVAIAPCALEGSRPVHVGIF